MAGPHGYDVEFSLILGAGLFLFMAVSCVLETYLDARNRRGGTLPLRASKPSTSTRRWLSVRRLFRR